MPSRHHGGGNVTYQTRYALLQKGKGTMLYRQAAASNTLTTETFFMRATQNNDIPNIVCPLAPDLYRRQGPSILNIFKGDQETRGRPRMSLESLE